MKHKHDNNKIELSNNSLIKIRWNVVSLCFFLRQFTNFLLLKENQMKINFVDSILDVYRFIRLID